MQPVKIGIVGCGTISGIYLKNLVSSSRSKSSPARTSSSSRARARAEEFGVPKACTVDGLLADPEIEIVINLTIPAAHGEVALAALEAGKSVYNEKPLAITRDEARQLLERRRRERPCASAARPTPSWAAAYRRCRKLIDDGAIGEPGRGHRLHASHGPESWHPDPDFYYQLGGGPMFDMGPYYLTALVSLIGPGAAGHRLGPDHLPRAHDHQRAEARQTITVDTPTHVAGRARLRQRRVGTIVTSFDVWEPTLPRIEIYGTEGTLSRARPQHLRRPGAPPPGRRCRVERRAADARLHREQPRPRRGRHGARAAPGPAHRASGELAYHVLDIMHAFHDASAERPRHPGEHLSTTGRSPTRAPSRTARRVTLVGAEGGFLCVSP